MSDLTRTARSTLEQVIVSSTFIASTVPGADGSVAARDPESSIIALGQSLDAVPTDATYVIMEPEQTVFASAQPEIVFASASDYGGAALDRHLEAEIDEQIQQLRVGAAEQLSAITDMVRRLVAA